MRRSALALALLLLAPSSAAGATLQQLPGCDGCVRPSAERGCAVSSALSEVSQVVVAPDGHHAYVSSSDGTIVGFRRARSGALRQIGCVSAHTRRGCTRWPALDRIGQLALARDGRTLYAAFLRDDDFGVAVLRRDRSTGALKPLQCWTRLGAAGCATAPGDGARLALSPDGRQLLTAGTTEGLEGGGTALTSYAVSSDGKLSNPVCRIAGDAPDDACPGAERIAGLLSPVSAFAFAPDGSRVYVAAGTRRNGQLTVLGRDPAAGALTAGPCFGDGPSCRPAPALDGPNDVAVPPDGKGVLVAALNVESPEDSPNLFRTSAVASFAADPFAQAGCFLSAGSSDEGCSRDRRFRGVYSVAATDSYVVASAYFSGAVALLRRDRATQALRRVACVSDRSESVDSPVRSGCGSVRGLEGAAFVSLSPDGRNVYAVDDRAGLVVLRLRR